MDNNHVIAIFIDAENINYNDFNKINNIIENKGRIIVSNIYADWSEKSTIKWKEIAFKNGITCIQCDKISGKNSVDLKLTVDIMRYLYTNLDISFYYIVSTDSDFRHVVNEIKSKNKKINCIGYNNANISIKSICDNYIIIEDNKSKSKNNDLNYEIEIKLKKYLENTLVNLGQITLGKISNIIDKKYPELNYKKRGFTKLSSYIKYLLGKNIIVEGNNVYINVYNL